MSEINIDIIAIGWGYQSPNVKTTIDSMALGPADDKRCMIKLKHDTDDELKLELYIKQTNLYDSSITNPIVTVHGIEDIAKAIRVTGLSGPNPFMVKYGNESFFRFLGTDPESKSLFVVRDGKNELEFTVHHRDAEILGKFICEIAGKEYR